MKKLLYVSTLALLAACHTSEETVGGTFKGDLSDSLALGTDTMTSDLDSLNLTVEEDSIIRINHGSQEQEKLDSIKKAKLEEKK